MAARLHLSTTRSGSGLIIAQRAARCDGNASRPPVQATWTWYTPGQTNEDANAYIHELHQLVSDALGQWKCGDNYIEELHSFCH